MKIFIAIGIALGIIMLIYYLRSSHPVKNALKSMTAGVVALLIIWYFGDIININMPLSFFNTGVSLILGIPGVVLLVLGQYLLV